MSEQPGPTERGRDAPPGRRVEEEAMRGPTHSEDPEEEREQVGLDDEDGGDAAA